jgi:hypothetical protein
VTVNRTHAEVEIIDTLSYAIEKQSAVYLDFMKHAVASERAECATLSLIAEMLDQEIANSDVQSGLKGRQMYIDARRFGARRRRKTNL